MRRVKPTTDTPRAAICAKRFATWGRGEPVEGTGRCAKRGCYRAMHPEMSETTSREVMARLRRRYATAGRIDRRKLVDEAVEVPGCHRKAAIRALGRPSARPGAPALIGGRPREYHPDRLLPVVKAIWMTAGQPCALLLRAQLPAWLEAYQQDHRRLDSDITRALLRVSARTLDRLLSPLRVKRGRRGGTRPGSMLRDEIPIRGRWEDDETGLGWMEV